MTENLQQPAAAPAGGAMPPAAPSDQKLHGRMGIVELVFSVLAFSAPVAVVSGFIPFVIVFQGVGAPSAFLVAAVLLLLFSVGYTTMSRYLPNPGAFYAYISVGLGKVPGLGASFLALGGYLMLALGTYEFFSVSMQDLVVTTFQGPTLPAAVYGVAAVAVVGLLGYRRIDLSAKVLSVAMVAEVAIVVIFDVAVFANGGPEGRSLEPFSLHAMTSGSVGIAVLFAATCFLGFEATAIFRDEVKDPRKTVPRATYLAVGFIGVFYIAASWMLITAFGVSNVSAAATADTVGMFGSASMQYIGVVGHNVVSVLLVTSIFAAVLSVQNILARYLHSLGVDQVLPAAFGRVHPKHGSPHVASLFITAILLSGLVVFTLLGIDPAVMYSLLAGAGGFCLITLMFLTSVAVIVYFRKRPVVDSSRWHTAIAPSLATVGLGVVMFLAIGNFDVLTGGSTAVTLLLQGIIWAIFVAGVVLALVYRRVRPEVYQRIGRG